MNIHEEFIYKYVVFDGLSESEHLWAQVQIYE